MQLKPNISNTRIVTGATYIIDRSDHTIRGDATAAAQVFTLPFVNASLGRIFVVKKIDATANTVTLQGNSVELIDGANTQVISTRYDSLTVQSNGVSWDILK